MSEFPEFEEIKARLFLMESHDATVARAEMEIGERIFEVNASAKKHPIDREDQRIGELYAMGRTLERMGKKMQKLADGYVREADNVRLEKKNRKERKGNKFGIGQITSGDDNSPFPRWNPVTREELNRRYGSEDNPNKSIL
jgi:hypothetical protein